MRGDQTKFFTLTCSNNDVQVILHIFMVQFEIGNMWSCQLHETLLDSVSQSTVTSSCRPSP